MKKIKKFFLTFCILLISLGAFGQMRYVRSTNTLKLAEDTAISKSYVRTNYLPTANAAQVLGRYGLEIIGDGNNNDTLYLQADTTFVQTLSDTFPYFAPIIGYGNATDTALFSLNDVIWGVKWESSHSFVITKVTAVVYGTSPDIDIALLHDVNFRDAIKIYLYLEMYHRLRL